MSLAEEYERQNQWRNWDAYLNDLPVKQTDIVLDMGCGTGQLSRLLVQRCLQVIGIDQNPELLEIAKQNNQTDNVSFVNANLNDISRLDLPLADGIWCSFTAAYFTDFNNTLSKWLQLLKPGGWLALVEIDNLFGHHPLSSETEAHFKDHYKRLRDQHLYDFEMGSKLKDCVVSNGLAIILERNAHDEELAFNGPASNTVIAAWENRLDRMTGLQKALGYDQFQLIKDEFLNCLRDNRHECSATVKFIVAIKTPNLV